MNITSSPPLSGWYFNDSARYCFLISDILAPLKKEVCVINTLNQIHPSIIRIPKHIMQYFSKLFMFKDLRSNMNDVLHMMKKLHNASRGNMIVAFF